MNKIPSLGNNINKIISKGGYLFDKKSRNCFCKHSKTTCTIK